MIEIRSKKEFQCRNVIQALKRSTRETKGKVQPRISRTWTMIMAVVMATLSA